ncbi:GAF domain-containing protein, partial [bacterium]
MNLKEICQTLSREIQKLVPYDRAAINILQRDEKFFSVYAEESRLPTSAIPEGVSVREGTATSWVLDHKEPLICRDALKDPRFPLTHKRYKNVGLRSYVILPLMVKGKVLGALNLGSLKPRCYGKKEVAILSPVAEILSLAIENSNLYEESQRREETQKLLKELSQDITSLDLDSLLKKLTASVREVLKVDVSDVRVFGGDRWRLMGISGIDPNLVPSARTGTAFGRSRWIIEHRKPLLIRDAMEEKDLPSGKTVKSLGLQGYLGVPLFSKGGEVIGVLRALSYQPRDFTQDEVDFSQQLANGAATALENARLFEEVRRKSRELESLIKVNRAVAALLDRKTLLPRIAEEARSLIKMDVASFRLIEGDSMVRAGYAGNTDLLDLRPKMQLGESITGRIIREARPIAIKHIQDEPTIIEEHRDVYRKRGYHSFLG